MDKLLRPKDLEADPNAANAEKVFKFWLRTVEDFIEALVETQPEQARANFNKKRAVSCLSPAIYEYVEEAETYERVIEILKRTFIKRKNNVYARHLLVSRRQGSNESIAEYLRALKTFSKDCTFRNVTAQEYQEELVRDSFINGLSSAVIRQRLLENDELSVDRAFELADNLDRAYQHAVSFNTFQTPSAEYQAATAIPLERSILTKQNSEKFKDQSEIFAVSTKKIQCKCYFCGGPMHTTRAMCPAKNAVCHGYKQGHYVKVCRKIKANTAAAYSSSEFDHNPETEWGQSSLASVLATAPECLSHALIKAKMKGKEVDALIDSGASRNFIDSKVAAELKITVHGEGSEISMASQELVANTHGSLKTSILVLNRSYLLNFEVIDKL